MQILGVATAWRTSQAMGVRHIIQLDVPRLGTADWLEFQPSRRSAENTIYRFPAQARGFRAGL